MSDEPAPLRLKPRLASPGDGPRPDVPGPESLPMPPSPGADDSMDGTRLRLRPRPLVAAAPPVIGPDFVAAPLPPIAGAASATGLPLPPMPDPGPPLPGTLAAAAPFPSSSPPARSMPPAPSADIQSKLRTQPLFRLVTAPAGIPPDVVSNNAHMPKGGDDDIPSASFVGPEASRAAEKKGRGGLVAAMVAVLVLGGGGFYAYQTFFRQSTLPPDSVKKVTSPVKVAVTPAAVVPPAAPAADVPGRARPPSAGADDSKLATATTMAVAPGVVIATPDEVATAEASAAFRAFVAEVKISGVVANPPARAVLNGRLVRAGQIVGDSVGLNIVFVGVDSERRLITFKESSGAIVARRY